MIRLLASGIVYKNPKPHLKAVHAWHPSVARLPGGELLATFDLGQAVESFDYHTCLARSADEGQTWSSPVPLFRDAAPGPATHSVRVGAVADGTLVGLGARFHRDNPDEGCPSAALLDEIGRCTDTTRRAYTEGVLQGVIVTLKGSKVSGFQLVTG